MLHAFYRVTPAGNRGPRPPWFSKRLALRSFLAACAPLGPDVRVVSVADGGSARRAGGPGARSRAGGAGARRGRPAVAGDGTTVTTVQGVPACAWRHLYANLWLKRTRASAQCVVERPVLRALADLAALDASGVRVARVTSLATHCEADHLAPGTDWAAVAASVP